MLKVKAFLSFARHGPYKKKDLCLKFSQREKVILLEILGVSLLETSRRKAKNQNGETEEGKERVNINLEGK